MKKELFDYFNSAGKLKARQNGDVYIEDGFDVRQIKSSKLGVERCNFFNYLMVFREISFSHLFYHLPSFYTPPHHQINGQF